MKPSLWCARFVLAPEVGVRLAAEQPDLPHHVRLITANSAVSRFLSAPFHTIPIAPAAGARYVGEPLALMAGPAWGVVDAYLSSIRFEPAEPVEIARTTGWEALIQPHVVDRRAQASRNAQSDRKAQPDGVAQSDRNEQPDGVAQAAGTPAEGNAAAPERTASATAGVSIVEPQVAEASYTTEAQLHIPGQPMRVRAETVDATLRLEVPTHWFAHTVESVAAVTGRAGESIRLVAFPDPSYRDAAVVFPAIMACWAALANAELDAPVIVALRHMNEFLYGARPAVNVRAVTDFEVSEAEHIHVRRNHLDVHVRCGAYPALGEELHARALDELVGTYDVPAARVRVLVEESPTPPALFYEGLWNAQLAFAREMHATRMAELADQDPLEWRVEHLQAPHSVAVTACRTVGEMADFSRRYASAQLVRKRSALSRADGYPMRGVGIAVTRQAAGFLTLPIGASIAVQLERDAHATLFCSLPAVHKRLAAIWCAIVARELGIEPANVRVVEEYQADHNGGPAVLSRGITLIPPAIETACAAIQRQRFRKPLPLRVRRPVRDTLTLRNGANRSVAACSAEVTVDPVSLNVAVRSIMLAVYAGTVGDRTACEFELRRGVHQALAWTLGESVPDSQPVAVMARSGKYHLGSRGAHPKLKITFLPGGKNDPLLGVGELAFSVVPAAIVSAVGQATGLYLDSLPLRPSTLLRYLEEQ